MLTCRKLYSDIPFAHRQHLHDGHCAFIHGHNWNIAITFGCHHTDENEFVVDFGKLHTIKKWIQENLDHACLFNADDPMRETLLSAAPGLWKPYILPNCSSEGIARHLFEVFNPMVESESGGRAFIISIEVDEDSKNSTLYSPPRNPGAPSGSA